MDGQDIRTERFGSDAAGIARAGDLLRSGALVAFPTETVYGLGADARNARAVAKIYQAKTRPSFNPLIVHVANQKAAQTLAHFNADARRLADTFWPGPLTLVLPLRAEAGVSALVTAGLESIAIRVPGSALARAVLDAAQCPIAAPSANPSGRISPTNAAHVLAGLDGKIDAVLDGGACAVGLESTIIGVTGPPTLLRPGGLPDAPIEACLGHKLAMQSAADTPNAPGQLTSHYAPKARMRLNAGAARAGERVLGFGPVEADLNLSRAGDLVEAAANLFHHLHLLDRESSAPIAVSPIPETGLGLAINDRLKRAAAPRPR